MIDANKTVWAAVALAAAGFSTMASAVTATASFNVRITIVGGCTVTAGVGVADIDFGSVVFNAGDVQANNSGNIVVNCTNTVPYSIGLTPSNASTTGVGAMTGPGSPIAYQLRSTAGLAGTVWGNVIGTNTVAGTGIGAAQPFTAFATALSADHNVAPGSYVDTVTVTVTY